MFECEQNCSRFSECETISEPFEKCSNFQPISKATTNQQLAAVIELPSMKSNSMAAASSESSENMAAPEGIKTKKYF